MNQLAWHVYRDLLPAEARDRTDQLPESHVLDPETGEPEPFHRGQELSYACPRRFIGMFSGYQGGKTIFGPAWMDREIGLRGPGDYFAVSATYDLFKLKMLPALLQYFEHTLGIGRYWAGDKILELAEPDTGAFLARESDDPMWARIILRSADSKGGLESGTAKAAWADECGQDKFTYASFKALKRRLTLYRGRLLMTSTLYDPGWVDTDVIQKAQKGGKTKVEKLPNGAVVEVTDNAQADIGLVQFDSIANPAFPEEEYEKARTELPDDEFQSFLRGRRVGSRTLVYDCFDRTGGRNTCPRFAIPDDWTRYLGLDFGGQHTAAVFLAEEPTTLRLFVYRIYMGGGKLASGHVQDILQGERGRPRTYGGSSSEDQWRTEFASGGLGVIPPPIRDVDLGINRVYATVKTAGLVVFDDLAGLLDEFSRYRYQRDRLGNVTKDVEAKQTFHLLDALRYVVSSIRGEVARAKVRRLGSSGT
jgi:hypothetical protein